MSVPAAPFSRSLASLRADGYRGSLWGLALVALLLSAWGAWFLCARVTLYAVSAAARTEIDRAVHPVVAQVAGSVEEVLVALGGAVAAGDPLVRLDAQADGLLLAEERAREGSLEREIAVLDAELAARERARSLDLEVGAAAATEGAARLVELELDLELARVELERAERLQAVGTESVQELGRRRTEAERGAARTDTQRKTMDRQELERETRASVQEAEGAGLARERAELLGALQTCRAACARIEDAIERRTLRAPASGEVAELAGLARGAWVEAGEAVATVVAPGEVTVRATFTAAEAVGRIRPGQVGRMRLDGFPWAQYGTLPVRVARVGSEARGGGVQVELVLAPGAAGAIPLHHGLPGSVEVAVEEVAPWRIAVRAAGGHAAQAAAAPAEAR